jgi:hypothetical protein
MGTQVKAENKQLSVRIASAEALVQTPKMAKIPAKK